MFHIFYHVLLDSGGYEASHDPDISPNEAQATGWLAKGEEIIQDAFKSESLLKAISITGHASYWWPGS